MAPGPLIAHRGCSKAAPENTLAAYQLAADKGFTWIETDVQITKDAQAIMMHDYSVDRTTNGKGFVCNSNFSDLKGLDASNNIKGFTNTFIPTLEETIEWCLRTDMGIILELKPISGTDIITAKHVLSVLTDFWQFDNDKLIVSSFSAASLLFFKENAPHISTALATQIVTPDPERYIEMLGVSSLHFLHTHENVNQDSIDKLKSTGVYTAVALGNNDNAVVAKQSLEMGIDGAMTDFSDLFGDA